MRLYLIRHGQTDWNLAHRIQGKKDVPLNETGRQQAKLLAEGMKNRPVEKVFTSQMLRARETAEILADSQHVPLYLVKGLEEIHYGEWEGLTWEEIEKKFPEEYEKRQENLADHRPPGGENQMDVVERAVRATNAIRQDLSSSHATSAAVVSHGMTICCILFWLLRNSSDLDDGCSINNASVTTVDWDLETDTGKLVELNDIRHLECLYID